MDLFMMLRWRRGKLISSLAAAARQELGGAFLIHEDCLTANRKQKPVHAVTASFLLVEFNCECQLTSLSST